MPQSLKERDIAKIQGRSVFLDANILLEAFGPPRFMQDSLSTKVSNMLDKLVNRNVPLYIDANVVSEFVNAILRSEYSDHLEKYCLKSKDFNFKKYRNSSEGQEVTKKVYGRVHRFGSYGLKCTGRTYSFEDIKSFLVVNELDFNDKLILALCQDEDFVLFTKDSDFSKQGIDILQP